MIQATRPKPVVLGAATTVGAVLLNERLQGEIVVVAAIECGCEFAAHAVGVLAADVIALEQDLVAAADAHQVMAQVVEAGVVIADAQECEQSDHEQAK